jgi:HEPN domain-containing protein
MKTVSDLVRGWLAKGDSDLAEAQRCAHSRGPYDTGCFHCQQAVEKYIKAVFSLGGRTPLKTHNLRQLISELEATEPSLKLARPEIISLTNYAVDLRYDTDFWPSQKELVDALAVARQVRLEIFSVIPASTHPASGPP